jgi:6-phosphofructokinase 2
MVPILTITTNPAVDLATSVDHVIAGPKLRCRAPRVDPGGGGINVARAIHKLGGEAVALVAAGGAMGERLLSLLAAEGVPSLPVSVAAETRQSFAVTDESTGEQFRFSVPGNPLTEAEGAALLRRIAEAAPVGGFAVYSGSVAPGLPVDFVAQVNACLSPKGTRLVVDVSAPALHHILAHPVQLHALRIDQEESATAAGRPMDTVEDSRRFAAALVAQGVADIVVTGRGAEGSVLASRDTQLFGRTPPVPVRSKIGAGDTFVGAFTLSLARGEKLSDALCRGVAGASATVSTEGTALCTRADAEALFAHCQIEEITP